jgi:hypothetical protein
MATLNFREFVDKHPEILADRHKLSFTRDSDPKALASQFRESGVIMLRDVIPTDALRQCREAFGKFVATLARTDRDADLRGANNPLAVDDGPSAHWDKGEEESGSWHPPWVVRHKDRAPTAIVLGEFIRSWAWPVIEAICDSKEIVVMFGLCLARHRIDEDLPLGVHQDSTAVNPDVPLSIWIPLGEVAPRRHSGLGFIVPSPGHPLPADDDNDVGMQYVVDNLDKVWVPHYQPGDLTVHSRFSPHFTTGYGTHSERYSLEIRLWAKEDRLMKYYDPSLWVSRRNGVPVVIETKCSLGIGAHGFLASTALQVMHGATASATEPRRLSLPRAVMGALRSVVR